MFATFSIFVNIYGCGRRFFSLIQLIGLHSTWKHAICYTYHDLLCSYLSRSYASRLRARSTWFNRPSSLTLSFSFNTCGWYLVTSCRNIRANMCSRRGSQRYNHFGSSALHQRLWIKKSECSLSRPTSILLGMKLRIKCVRGVAMHSLTSNSS